MRFSSLDMAALELAVEYGAAVFPCESRGKRPHPHLAPHGFKNASAHPEQVCAWWDAAPDANIGLLPGSAGWLVLDVDGPTGAATAANLGLDQILTATVATGRGEHRYYRKPPGVQIGNVSNLPGCDVRCDAGYVLAAGSVHPSGHVYRWTLDLAHMVECPAALLDALERQPAPPLAHRHTNGAQQHAWQRSGANGDAAVRLARYLDAIGIIGEGSRNRTAFRVAALAIHELRLDVASALLVLQSWNVERCMPPLTTRELQAVVHSAARSSRRAA